MIVIIIKMNGQKEKIILECLKIKKELSTTKIRDKTTIPYDLLKILLAKLEKEKKVKSRKSKFGTFTYWRIKE